MDIKIWRDSIEVLVDDNVVKHQDINREQFKEYMYDLTQDDNDLLEAMRFIYKNMKPISTTFKGVKR